MAYADFDDVLNALDQFAGTDPESAVGVAIQDRLDWSNSEVNVYLGIDTDLAAAAPGTAVVYGNGGQILDLPPHTTGSVTLVTPLDGYTVPDYIERDGMLVVTSSTGVIASPRRYGLAYDYGSSSVWTEGAPYTVSAAFGWSADVLNTLRSITVDLTVQSWRYKDAGGSETVGAEGAVTTVRSGLTPRMKMDLDAIKRRVNGSFGVH